MSREITRELLQTTPLADLPGWEVRLFLITYPPGADANNHSHPVVGVGFVLEGVMVSAFDDDPEETFVAGQSFVDRASYHRIARNGSDTKRMKFLIAYRDCQKFCVLSPVDLTIDLEPIAEHHGKLRLCRAPFASRHLPLLGDLAQL
jgi:quercetin dioxygenase-like cupin family protein